MSVFQILVIRSFFTGLVAAIIIRSGKEKFFGEKETYGLLLARALFGSLSFIGSTTATFLLPLVDAVFLINIYPGWLSST